MNEAPIPTFEFAIRAIHGASARLIDRVPVDEHSADLPVWQGEVLVFELVGHPTATRCYAWEVDGEVTAVLHEPPVESPQTAVRAAIMAGSEYERPGRA